MKVNSSSFGVKSVIIRLMFDDYDD